MDSKKRILFIYERRIIPTFGGVERVTYLLSQELRKRGYDVEFLSVGPDHWNQEEVDCGFTQSYISIHQPDFRTKYNDFLSSIRPDVIIFQGAFDDVVNTLAMSPEGPRKFLVVHNQPLPQIPFERYIKRRIPWKSLGLKGKMLKALALVSPRLSRVIDIKRTNSRYHNIISHADSLVFLSDRFIPRVLKYMPSIPEDKLQAINNPNTFRVDNQAGAAKEDIVLFVGRMDDRQKNVTGFIKVWKRFQKTHPEWKALVVGAGEDAESIKKYAGRMGVKNLSFEGNRKNIEDYYRRAKILAMTSAYEGWGMVIPEAMAYGCVPVVYESFEAVHDLIDSGKNGLIVEALNPEAMALGLASLVDDEEKRKQMASEGKDKIKQFEVEKIVDRWEHLFNS